MKIVKHSLFSLIMISMLLVGCGGGGSGSNPSGINVSGNDCSITGKITMSSTESEMRAVETSKVVGNAKVYLEELPDFSTMTKSDGSYTLSGFPKGSYHLVAKYVANNNVYKMRSDAIDISANQKADEIEIKEAKNTISGCLKDETGNYLTKGTKLTLWGEEFFIGDNGEFITPPLPNMSEDKILNNIIILTNNNIINLPVEFTSDVNTNRLNCVVSNTTGAITSLNIGPNLELPKYYGTWNIIKELDSNNKPTQTDLKNAHLTISAYGANPSNCIISKTYPHPDFAIHNEEYVSTYTCSLDGDIWKIKRYFTPSQFTSMGAADVVDYRIEIATGSLLIFDPDENKTSVSVKDNIMTIIDTYGITRQLKKVK